MNAQIKRLALATLISSSVFLTTWFWYKSTENKVQTSADAKPLAYIEKPIEDIQRRPATRLLWQEVNDGEPLYDGEAIRSAANSEVRIIFADSDRYLDLEPESLIVIKKSKNEIALDLMEGSLFVNAQNTSTESGPSLVLNSEKGTVDLTGASASLSKSSGKVDVQVIEGKAQIKSNNGDIKDLSKNNTDENGKIKALQILSPQIGKKIYINAEQKISTLFKWEKISEGNIAKLYIGKSRKDLKEIVQAKNANELSTNLDLGKYFWKIAIYSDKNLVAESNIYRSEVVARFAPVIVSPLESESQSIELITHPNLSFAWSPAPESKQVSLQIWEDAELKNKFFEQKTSETKIDIPFKRAGTYYWTVSSLFEDEPNYVSSKVQKFTLVSAKPKEILKPEPLGITWLNSDPFQVQYYVHKPAMELKWETPSPERVAHWKITLSDVQDPNSSPQVFESKENKLSTELSRRGRYIASVEAIDAQGNKIGASIPKTVDITELPLIETPKIFPLDSDIQASNDGKSEIQWEKIEGAKYYQLTIFKDGTVVKKSDYTKNSTSIKNLMPGEYQVQITAIDDYNRSSPGSKIKKLRVPASSNIKAPKLKQIKVN